MLIGCEFKRIKSAVGFETMLLFLQCSETLRASPQDTYACHVSLTTSALLMNFFKYVTLLLKKFGCVTASFSLHLILAKEEKK